MLCVGKYFSSKSSKYFCDCPAVETAEGPEEFIDLIKKRSDGRISAEFFPSGSLYKGLDLLQAVLRGDAEMTTLVSVYWSAISGTVPTLITRVVGRSQ